MEDLASNGESVRGKVFHIACALCAQSPRNEADQELIRDWCEMVSPALCAERRGSVVDHPPRSLHGISSARRSRRRRSLRRCRPRLSPAIPASQRSSLPAFQPPSVPVISPPPLFCRANPPNRPTPSPTADTAQFSAISFVQMPPPPPGLVDSRAQSPVHVGHGRPESGMDPGSAGTGQHTIHTGGSGT